MVPKIAARGKSFKGAARYYLHDKEAASSERVAFTETRNLFTDDADAAWRFMAYTANHANELKAAAGVAATGRKLERPVYSYSLAWHPDEKPTKEQMLAAGEKTLKVLGLDGCQALMVAHRDEPHQHLHIIVNLVDPENGKSIDPGLDKKKLSRWAEAYEREDGQIRCEQRVENNRRRDQGETAKDRASINRAEYEQRKKLAADVLKQRREEVWQRQVGARDELKKAAKARADAIWRGLKEKYKPVWAAYYRNQRQEERKTRDAEKSLLASLYLAIKERKRLTPQQRPTFMSVLSYAIDARAMGNALAAARDREKEEIRARIKEERDALVREVWKEFGRDYEALKTVQADERKISTAVDREELRQRYKAAADDLRRKREEQEKERRRRETDRDRGRDRDRDR